MHSPYSSLDRRAFWKTGVAAERPETIADLYRPKFAITPETAIATAGSCFAQHIARHLRARDFTVMDAERAPPIMPDSVANRFGYRLFSARFGNVYVVKQLLQIAEEALSRRALAMDLVVWERGGRFFDAMRPSVEPEGLDSPEEVMAHREQHLAAVRRVLRKAELFVFTLGLTEYWRDRETKTAFPTAPGTIAGTFDSARHEFHNAGFAEIVAEFEAFRALVREHNPDIRFLLTVSPVPLTATASGDHVLAATTYSKSVLRAAAGELAKTHDDIDYFPSYEMIATPFSRGAYYEPNLRSVHPDGVEQVMRVFLAAHGFETGDTGGGEAAPAPAEWEAEEDALCDDVLLEQFAPAR